MRPVSPRICLSPSPRTGSQACVCTADFFTWALRTEFQFLCLPGQHSTARASAWHCASFFFPLQGTGSLLTFSLLGFILSHSPGSCYVSSLLTNIFFTLEIVNRACVFPTPLLYLTALLFISLPFPALSRLYFLFLPSFLPPLTPPSLSSFLFQNKVSCIPG